MAETLQFQLVSPERMLVDERVSEVQIPARKGYIGVLAGHAPLLSELMDGGVVSYQVGADRKTLAVYGGFVEVQPGRVRVLADAAEFGSEIDIEKAKARLATAVRATGNDPAALLAEVAKAQAAVDAIGKK
jgi:F-type H+-transporting ATPase subunit epsilon